MIPKTIHYCWFSNDRKPRLIQRCIDSWVNVMPEYKIKCWDGHSFDFESVPFVRDAMNAKKYAFAADYVRLYAIYTEGGIYLDSDVLVTRPFDTFLSDTFFCGTEAYMIDNELNFRMEAAIMGAEKGNTFVEECMSFYHRHSFSVKDTSTRLVMPAVISKIAEYEGYRYENRKQELKGLTIYPTTVFTNTLHPETNSDEIYAIHQNAGSWIEYSDRGWLFRFCKKNNLMYLYHWLEKIRK